MTVGIGCFLRRVKGRLRHRPRRRRRRIGSRTFSTTADRPGFHKGWLLTSRSASPDIPRSSGHLRTAVNQRLDSSVTRLLLPLDCPSTSRRDHILPSVLSITSILNPGFFQLSNRPSCRLKQRPQRGSKVREPLLDPSPSSLPSDFFSSPPRADLQLQYSTYKNTLQQIAQKIGDVEQEAEEHK